MRKDNITINVYHFSEAEQTIVTGVVNGDIKLVNTMSYTITSAGTDFLIHNGDTFITIPDFSTFTEEEAFQYSLVWDYYITYECAVKIQELMVQRSSIIGSFDYVYEY